MIVYITKKQVLSDDFAKQCCKLFLNGMKQTAENETFEIVRDNDGKPRFKSGDVKFSLSHSGEVTAVCMAECEVGLDVELVREIDFNKFSSVIVATTRDEFFKEWTKRESYLKFTGKGLTALRSKIPNDVHINTMELDGYILSVCSKKKEKINLVNFDGHFY